MPADARAVMEDYVAATERRDVAVVSAHLAPDVVLHSPVTRRPFVGREEVTELLEALLEELDEIEYTHKVPLERGFFVVFRMRFGRREVHGCNLIDLDAEGRIARETIYARPLAGSAVFAQALGPRLAARHGRWRARMAGAAPLPALLEGVDRLGTRVARPHAVKRSER